MCVSHSSPGIRAVMRSLEKAGGARQPLKLTQDGRAAGHPVRVHHRSRLAMRLSMMRIMASFTKTTAMQVCRS